jgi:putative ABC transport system permease protein
MLRHALKLIWNRKRANGLIVTELVIAFLIVFVVSAVGAHALYKWRLPLGYEWHDTLEIGLSRGGQWTEEDGLALRRLLATLRNQPEILWAHTGMPLFRNWRWSTAIANNGKRAQTLVNEMTDGAPQDLGVRLVEGRWFNAGDASDAVFPLLIDERSRDVLFPQGVVLGADINPHDPEDEDQREWRVLGVFSAFRQMGEFTVLKPYMIGRFPIEDLSRSASVLEVRTRPGTPIEFEERLQRIIEAEAPSWELSITPLTKLRDERIRDVVMPLTISGLIATFLLLLVAFGLFGVLWQNVTRRTDELGLRRALGATRRRIYHQVVLETVLLAALLRSPTWRSSVSPSTTSRSSATPSSSSRAPSSSPGCSGCG